ncbi:hypothetical protein E2562_034306 [Oryza meyeriana var. granulata]|uniref:Cytochrome P450 n=1 Tax=Oryza meyeriana var. granulata TaxID=110450 RepID=A0A6G1FF32_9ORYZ|nr:hypothetical protein E2562_034306 [Oryza meyeriana var. granulata]
MRDANTGVPYSNKFLCDICVNFILVGHDTSSVMLAWFFCLLNKNPAVKANILDEIEDNVAPWKSPAATNGNDADEEEHRWGGEARSRNR